MALTIVATVGASDANSFSTEAEQIAYMATRLNATAWTTFTGAVCTESEKAAMIEATRELSALTGWLGYRVTTTQALALPRDLLLNPDDPTPGTYYLTTVIPQRVKDAACELAFQFLKAGTTDVAAASETAGIIEETVGPLTTRWASPSEQVQGLMRYPRVWTLIAPLLSTGASQVRLVR